MRNALRFVASAVLLLILAVPTLADSPPVKFLSVQSPVSPGGEGSVTIQTRPNTSCSIAVIYKSGPSQAHGLQPQTAEWSRPHHMGMEDWNTNNPWGVADNRDVWQRE